MQGKSAKHPGWRKYHNELRREQPRPGRRLKHTCAGAYYRLAMGRPPELKWHTVTNTSKLLDGGSVIISLNKGRTLFIPANVIAWTVRDKNRFRQWVKDAKSKKARHKPLIENNLKSAGFAPIDKKEPAWFRPSSKRRKENLNEIKRKKYKQLGVRLPSFPEKNKKQDSVCKILGH